MKLDRLMGILTLLLQNEKTTAPELARRFEVSRRTIQRDIEALSMAGIPVVTAQGGNGGISIMEGYRLGNRDAFTAQEQLINLYGYHEDSLRRKPSCSSKPSPSIVQFASIIIIPKARCPAKLNPAL
jgi:biotin operon repressor